MLKKIKKTVQRDKDRMTMSKFKFVGVHTLHFQLMDEDGNTDGKLYEYTGDHSSFADGIDPEELKEVAGE